MKSLFLGIVFIIIVGVGGLVYRNATEHPNQPIACPMDARVCPDGTAVGRTGMSCTFPECPPPNVSLPDIGIAYALPDGLEAATTPDSASIVTYELNALSTVPARIIIRRYEVDASSTPLATIQDTAVSATSGLPVPMTAYSSKQFGSPGSGFRSFTVVSIERFEGVVDTAYYLSRPNKGDVLRFDAIDPGVADWTDANLDTATLPAHAALAGLLATLQVL